MPGRVLESVARGAQAPASTIMLGALFALAVSVPLALALGLAAGVDGTALVLIVGAVQLVVGYAIAGRISSRGGQ